MREFPIAMVFISFKLRLKRRQKKEVHIRGQLGWRARKRRKQVQCWQK